MIRPPDADRAAGLLAEVADRAAAAAHLLSHGERAVALLTAERVERDAVAAREEIEDLIRVDS